MNSPAESQAISEYRLVERARSGHVASFGELVARYELDVRGFLRQRIRDQATADDLAQEVFLGAMKSINRLQHDSSIRSWLLSIARHKLIDFLRSKTSSKTVNQDVDAIFESRMLSQPVDDDQVDVVAALNACLDRLPPEASRLVEKYYFESMTAKQIAADRNQKSSTIRMSLLRIRRSLAKCIRRRMTGGDL